LKYQPYISKKDERTRKVHHIIFVPDFKSAETLRQKLSVVGNIISDGRPILGLDSRDLLEMTLESGEGSYIVPAHIWTTWFSVLGSRSGFDSISDCYADLADYIFAVESRNWTVL
jgi:PHP family Zn ribbon phosphoesterase